MAKIAELTVGDDAVIDGLQTELLYQAERRGEVPEGGFPVTIMGDKELPYWLLKKILLTCQQNDFAKVSLAVNKVGEPDAEVAALDIPAGAAT